MGRSIAVSLVVGSVLVVGTLLSAVVDVGPLHLVRPPLGLGAVVVGLLAMLLTSFTGCQSLPTDAEFAEMKGRINTLRAEIETEDTRIQLKLNELEDLLEKIREEGESWVSADEAKMAEWAEQAQRLRLEIQAEKDTKKEKMDLIMDTAEEAIEKGEDAKAKAEEQVGQSNVPPLGPTPDDEQYYVLGWGKYSEGLATALERARTAVAEKRIQSAKIVSALDEVSATLDEMGDPMEVVSLEMTIRQAGRLQELARSAVARHAELLHLAFADGWQDVVALADFFVGARGPTVVVNLDAKEKTQEVAFEAKVVLDENIIGPLTVGDVLVISLPEGFSLTEPLEVAPSPGIEVKACGNEAGRRTVSLKVTADSGEAPKSIVLDLDQDLTVQTAGSGLGEARIWNLRHNTGVVLPVSRIPC